MLTSTPCSSISFGKNKVAFEQFNWQKLCTKHFEIYYPDFQNPIPLIASNWAESIYVKLSGTFDFELRSRIPLILYNSNAGFQQTNIIDMLLPEGVNGFTTQLWNRVVVPYNGSLPEFRHVLHHELVHAFQYGIIFEQFGSSLISVAGTQMPFWFAEGLAEYLSSDWDNDADMFLMDAALNGRVPLPSPELHGYAAYKVGQSFIKFLA
jgi:hypothetical protein